MGYQVPAVRSAVRILSFLHAAGERPLGASAIARALGLNVSTCFNILKTLETDRFVACDPATRTYRLGDGLVHLASRAGTATDFIGRSLPLVRRLVGELGLTCVLVVKAPDDSFVVAERVEAVAPALQLAASPGQRFPPLSPVMVRAFWAWAPPREVDALIERHGGLPAFTQRSATGRRAFFAELGRTRQEGFSRSLREYYDWSNSVGSPVFDPRGRVAFALVLLGTLADLPEERVEACGRRLAEAAAEVTALIGGQRPAAPAGIRGDARSRGQEARRADE